jgi:DNA-binding phage protein
MLETTQLTPWSFDKQDPVMIWESMFRWLNSGGRLQPLLQDYLQDRLVVSAALAAGLTIVSEDVQLAADRFRQANHLSSAEDTHRWLADQQLSLADLEERLETELLITKFQQHLLDEQGEEYFQAHRAKYDRARLRRLVAPSEGAACEYLCRVTQEGASLAELARDHDVDPTARGLRGELGLVARWQMPIGVADAVFAAAPGAIVGPIATPQGFALYQVDEILPAKLDEATADRIREELFQAWVQQRLANIRIDLSGLA